MGDQVSGSPDLAEIEAFNNDLYFYTLIRLHESGTTDHYDILMDTNGGQFDYQVSVWPENNQAVFSAFPVTADMTPLDGVTAAQGQVIEIKIPLAAIQGKPVRTFFVQTWLGKETGDRMENLTPTIVQEVEPAVVAVVVVPTLQPTPEPAQSLEQIGPLNQVVYFDPTYTADTAYITGIAPYVARIGPNDEVLILDVHDDTIYQVGESGVLSKYESFPGYALEEFAFDPSENLWFSLNAGDLYRVENGLPVLVTKNVNRRFTFDTLGNVYAVDFPSHGVQKITPDGQVTVLAGDVDTSWVHVGPNDEIIVMSRGRLIQVQPDGQWRVVADGLGGEASANFGPDGKIYILDFSGLDSIDLITGKKQHVSWYDRFSNTAAHGIFDHAGRMLTWHANNPVIRLDFTTSTAEMLYQPRGNTTAMALAPDGKIYVAYGNRVASGETILYQIIDKTTLDEVFRVPYGIELSLTFAPDGTGYLGVGDRDKNGMIYQFDLNDNSFKELLQPQCWPTSMAVDPVNGNLWWFSCEFVHERDSTGKIFNYPIPKGTTNKFLSFAPDGTLYAIFWFGYSTANNGAEHGIYRREANGDWVLLTDMTHPDPGITWSMISVCPNGNLYAIQHMHGTEIGLDFTGIADTVFLINRTTGERTILASGISPDTFAVVCSPENHLIFTTIDGIVDFYQK